MQIETTGRKGGEKQAGKDEQASKSGSMKPLAEKIMVTVGAAALVAAGAANLKCASDEVIRQPDEDAETSDAGEDVDSANSDAAGEEGQLDSDVPELGEAEDQQDEGADAEAEEEADAAEAVDESEEADVTEDEGETAEATDVAETEDSATEDVSDAAEGESVAMCSRLSNESRATYFLTLDEDTPIGASGYSIKWTGPSADGRGVKLELACGEGAIPVASNDSVAVPSTWEVDRTATGEGKVTVYMGTMMGGRAVVSVTVSDVI